jgi:hypothetical protein
MRAPAVSPVARGTIFENRVFEGLTEFSNGEIVCYRPIADVEGTDLIVKRRHQAPVLKLQIKGRTAHRRGGAIELGIPVSELPEADPKYVVVLDYHPGRAELGAFLWVIHSADFLRLSSRSVGFCKALLSPSPVARDRWVDYRYNVDDLAWVIGVLLDAAERGEAPATCDEVRAAAKAKRK